MPYMDFTAGAVLTDSQVDTYLMRQTVMTFASAATRDAALSGVLDEGMVAYLEDAPNRLTYYDGSGWQTMLSEWASWSPSYSNLTVGNGTVAAFYRYAGMRTVQAKWRITLGTTSAVGSGPTLTLPVTPSNNIEIESTRVTLQDASTARHYGALFQSSGATVGLLSYSVSGSVVGTVSVSSTAPFTWTTSDVMYFTLTYEV